MKTSKIRINILSIILLLASVLTGCGKTTPTREPTVTQPTPSIPAVAATATSPASSTPALVATATRPVVLPPTSTATTTPLPTATTAPVATPTRSPTLTPTPRPTRQSLASPDKVEINTDYGTIEARYTGTNDQLIILIGENHASYKVQTNVARIAEQLLATYAIPLLLIEGYDSIIDTSFFDAIPDPEIRRQVAWAFLEAHEISGIEYAALISGPDVRTVGVENMDLWQESKDAVDNEPSVDDPAVQQAWEALIDQVVALIEKLEYTSELDGMVADFVEEEIAFYEFYEYLLDTGAEESVSTSAMEAAYWEFQATLSPVLKLASERDPYMLDNALAAMSQYDSDVAVLLVGHAHFLGPSEEGGLSALLQNNGISYVYVLPDGTEEETTDEENQYYEEQLNEIPSAFEAWLNDLFKPKPSITRPNQRAAIEGIGKVMFLESLAQAGANRDDIFATHADWLSSGTIHIQDRFDVAGKFSVYPSRVRGTKKSETFVVTVSASGSEPQISHQDDLIARWPVGDAWITAVRGRSADILIRRGIVTRHSDPERRFAFPYEINDGTGIAWQVGDGEVIVPDISWDTFNDLLDPEMPVEEREAKIQTALGGGAEKPPFGGDGGPIIIFPEDADYVPDDEDARAYQPGGDNYDKGQYFHPSYDDEWLLDWPALVIMLGQWLERPIYNDGDPEAAKENLDQQEPARVDNLGVIVDDASLDEEQRRYARQIPDAIENAGIAPVDVQISFSLDEFPTASNLLFVTAENDQALIDSLTRLGEGGFLKDKFIVLFTCGDEGLRDFASWVVREYEMTGLHVYRDKIHANTLPVIIGEVYKLAKEEPGLAPAELVDRATKRALEKALQEELKQNLNRLKNGWDQLSRQPGLQGDGVALVEKRMVAGSPG